MMQIGTKSFVLLTFLVMGLEWFDPHVHLSAQTTSGAIVGTVTDSEGHVIVQAQIAVTNLGTGEKYRTVSDDAGNYAIHNLAPGNYVVYIEKAGFKSISRPQIAVGVQAIVRVDVTLPPGNVQEVIQVTALSPVLQTQEASLGTEINSRMIQEAPLNGRNVLNLAELSPGVVPQGGSLSNPTGGNIFAWGNYQIGGGTANQSVTYVDGGPVNVNYVHLTALVPTEDFVREYKVQTNNQGPEFGLFTGGVINIATRSGSNRFHGAVYEYLRNKVLNANTYFNNESHTARPAFTQNQYGVEVDGPIRRDKTFFAFGWENFALRQGQSFLMTVPTNLMRQGDFSELGINIYDPLTTCGVAGTPACAPSQPTRAQFQNYKLTRISPVANALLREWPMPNLPKITNNYSSNAASGGNSSQYNVRIDHAVSDKQHVFGRFTRWNDHDLGVDPLGTGSYTNSPADFHTTQIVVDDAYARNPSTLFDLRLAYLRFTFVSGPNLNVDLNSLKFPTSFTSAVQFHTYPNLNVQNISNGYFNVAKDVNNSYSIMPSIVKTVGLHTIKAGAEIRRVDQAFIQNNNPGGSFSFDNTFTASDPTTATTSGTGVGFASFLLGYGASGAADYLSNTVGYQFLHGIYAGDSIRVTPHLTVNAGVRWDYPGPWTERHNQLITFQPGAADPLASVTGLPVKGDFALVNSAQRPARSQTDPHWTLFSPRIGVAYSLSDKLVARSGYGIFYIPPDTVLNMEPYAASINTTSTPWVPSLNGGATPSNTLDNPFPNGIQRPVGRSSTYRNTLYGTSVSAPVASEPYGNVQQWNLAVQREIGEGGALELAYAGSKGTHLPGLVQNLDQLPNKYLAQGTNLLKQVSNPFYGVITNGSLAAPTVQAGQLLRPYPQFTGVSDAGSFNRSSIYHSLQASFHKRFRSAGTVLASYTWSKLISNTDTQTAWLEQGAIYATTYTGPQDNYNPSGERSLSLFDVPQRLVLGYTVDLPFGAGRRWLSQRGSILGLLAGGWSVNGVTTLQTGFPVAIIALGNYTSTFGGGNTRPNVLAGCSRRRSGSAQSRLSGWFNTSCFTQPDPFSFGNESRADSAIRAAGVSNWDFAAAKTFRAGEHLNVEFRSEFFNLFNRVQFGSPAPQLGTAQFGQVSSQVNNPRLVQFALRTTF
jgi:hypothetical protein